MRAYGHRAYTTLVCAWCGRQPGADIGPPEYYTCRRCDEIIKIVARLKPPPGYRSRVQKGGQEALRR
jgi:hypothetical protein